MATSPGGGVLGVHPVLVRLGRQVVVDRLGEDLRAPPGAAQDVAQQQGVGPGGVVRVERGDELVDGHRRPRRRRSPSGSRLGGGTVARTAVTR